jgi:predicted nucleic acid-binding Zn ribbon protein
VRRLRDPRHEPWLSSHGIEGIIASHDRGFSPRHARKILARVQLAMPTYIYEFLTKDGKPTGKTCEIVHSIKAEALTKHPETGEPVRRIPAVPSIAGKWSDVGGKGNLSNTNLERLGFTKYERKGKGYMERVAGKEGPRSISAD